MRTLTVNIGNTSILAGVFTGRTLTCSFRCPTKEGVRGLEKSLAECGIAGLPVERCAVASVVPALTEAILAKLQALFKTRPLLLTAKAAHGLKIGYRQPARLGTDRLAAILGARSLAPGKHLLVVDCGTASTVTALHKDGLLCGGAILPGVGLWAEILATQTAQLPRIRLHKPRHAVGRSPEEAIASGLYHGHAGALRHLCNSIAREAFGDEPHLILGTGGNAALFAKEKLFTRLAPSLILLGLRAFAASSKEHA